MFGIVEAYNEVHQIGLIKATNGEIFSFGPNEWDAPDLSPRLNMEVQFERAAPGSKWKKAYYILPVQKSWQIA